MSYSQSMEPTAAQRDQAAWAYYVSFASLGMGLPIPFLSLVAGVIYHVVQHRKHRLIAFHSWQALLLGLPASLVVGVWSIQGLGYLFGYFLSAGHLEADLSGFWILGGVSAALLVLEIVLGLRGAAAAQRGEESGLGPLGALSRRLVGRRQIEGELGAGSAP